MIGAEHEPTDFSYLKVLVVVSKTFEGDFSLLQIVFERLRGAGLKLSPEKCHFSKMELKYMGHTVNFDGIATDPDKVQSIRDFPTPTTVRKLQSFLVLASWYRRFIE